MLISSAFIDWHISHNEFVSVNNALRQYNDIKKAIKNPTTFEFRQCINIISIINGNKVDKKTQQQKVSKQ